LNVVLVLYPDIFKLLHAIPVASIITGMTKYILISL
jgi:hypothetical protein